MIRYVFEYITKELNSYLKAKFYLNEDIVFSLNLPDIDQSSSSSTDNRLILSLVNIKHDTSGGSPGNRFIDKDLASDVHYYPCVNLDLFVLVSAFFNKKNYYESLAFLSEAIGFFQKKPVFNRQNSPGLNEHISRLAFEISDTDMNQLSNLWGINGGKYKPCILYKVKTITIDSMAVQSIAQNISSAESSANIKKG